MDAFSNASLNLAGAEPVAIINEAMARAYRTDEDPIGKRMKLGAPRARSDWRTIIGAARNIPHRGLDSEARPDWYIPHSQAPVRDMFLFAPTSGEPLLMASQIRQQVLARDSNQPLTSVQTMEEVMAHSLAPRRFNMLMAALFAAVALVLAAAGIYSVVLYSVTERKLEIGIRQALGAQASDVLRLVIGQGMMLTLTGIAIGLASAFAFTRVASSLLRQVSATDPLTFAVISSLLIIVALAACYVPARRATKVDPLAALRHE